MAPLQQFLDFLFKNRDSIKILGGAIAALTGVIKLGPPLRKSWRAHRNRKLLRLRLGAEAYTSEEILRATTYYIEPDCQSVDPSGGEDLKKTFAVRHNCFETIRQLIDSPSEHKYAILLADSGMGKTSFLLNYYARHAQNYKEQFNLYLVALGRKTTDQTLIGIIDKPNSVLFLDALDEDTKAIANHRERLAELLNLTADFRQVLITCRTQFFLRDEEIPRETGILRFGALAAGQAKEYSFYKLYLSPFSDRQVHAYISKRFAFFQRRKRKRAFEIAQRIPDLTVRPMLLAHIDDLLQSGKSWRYSFEIYDDMIEAWLIREEPYVKKQDLAQFSKLLAVDIYLNRARRGAEHIPPDEAQLFISRSGIKLERWQYGSRSLLNRDAAGNLKFAHRSVMEFLFVKAFFDSQISEKTEWTDQMKRFWWDMRRAEWANNHCLDDIHMEYVDFSGLDKLQLPPIVELRASPSVVSSSSSSKFLGEQGFIVNQVTKLMSKSWPEFYVKQELGNLYWFGSSTGFDQPSLSSVVDSFGTIDKSLFIIMDFVTGLMWELEGSRGQLSYADALARANVACKIRLGGFDDWRLPTFEESLALLPTRRTAVATNEESDTVFDDRLRSCLWTSDLSQVMVGPASDSEARRFRAPVRINLRSENPFLEHGPLPNIKDPSWSIRGGVTMVTRSADLAYVRLVRSLNPIGQSHFAKKATSLTSIGVVNM